MKIFSGFSAFLRLSLHFSLLFLSFSLSGQDQYSKIDSLQTLPTALIQATRVSSRSPIPHHNLRAAQLEKGAMLQDMPYLLSGLPSVVESSDAGAGVGYTGIRIRGSDPTRINVTLNGIPLNDAESQIMYWVDLPDLASSAAEVQVQRGVGSSTNGAGAFGATINVDLSKVSAEPFASGTMSLGSFNTRKNNLVLGTGRMSRGLNFSARISDVQSDGYIDRATVDLKSMHLMASMIQDKQMLQVHFLSGHEKTYQAWNGVPAIYVDDVDKRTFNSAGTEKSGLPHDNEVDDYTQKHILGHYKRVVSKDLSLQINGHYTRGYGYYEQYKARQSAADYGLNAWTVGDSGIIATDLIRRLWLDNHFYGSTFSLRWQAGDKSSLLLGGALSQYKGQHFGEIVWANHAERLQPRQRYYDNNARKEDWNVFLKADHQLENGLTAFGDVQFRGVSYHFLGYNSALENVVQQVDFVFFNPKVGLHYALSPNWESGLFSGIAHREPNRDDFTQSSPENRPKAESLWDTELSLRFHKKNGDIGLNVYFMEYDNQLVLDGRINDVGAYIRTNVPKSSRRGLELEGNLRPKDRVLFAGNLSLSQNKIKAFSEYRDNWDSGDQDKLEFKGTDLAYSPNVVGRVEAEYGIIQRQKQHFSVNFAWKYVGSQYLDNSGEAPAKIPSYSYADLRFNYRFNLESGKQLDLIFQVQNLFNQLYVSNGWIYRYQSSYDARPDNPYTRLESGNQYNQTGMFPQAGRNWVVTVRAGI